MQVISLQDCLTIMETGQPFSITYVTADRKRKSGGEVKAHDGCSLSKRSTVTVAKSSEITRFKKEGSRSPHHYAHSTRNIVLKNGDIRKVHIRLIIGFNGKRVVY